jgi:hypothetical protein
MTREELERIRMRLAEMNVTNLWARPRFVAALRQAREDITGLLAEVERLRQFQQLVTDSNK